MLYKERSTYLKQWHRDRQASLRSAVAIWKLEAGCADCGLKTNSPEIYDLDHYQGNKVNNVSRLISKRSPIELVVDELEKCEVVCANCHRLRTVGGIESLNTAP